MARERGASSPKKGMNRDKAAFDLQNVEYSFALNANIFDEHGSGDINLQNEPSNVYCSGFKDGFKVIGHKFDLNNDRTYFFLTNPDTGCSEIGYISSRYTLDGIQQVEKECGCSLEVILENPLEGQVQQAICDYITVVSDCENEECQTKCLNFSIDYPIYESNIHLKDEVIGRTIYFTDGLNPPRYINLDNLEQYTQDVDACTDEVELECLDCEEMRIFKLFEKPCLEVDTIQNGGNLRAGVYEALIAYSTKDGVEISDYYSLTNPLPIFDPNNVVLDQTDLNYLTNYSIKLKVSDLDTNYEFYTIVVIYRSGLDSAVSYYKIGVYPIDNNTVTINTTEDSDEQISLRDLLSRKPFYKTARGMASGNGYLFQYGMEAQREINLQPVVSLMGAFVKWSTVQANEDLYENGDNVAKYRGYMRDEVVPCSIKFILDGGYETPNFVFIPRPPLDSEIEELGAGYASDLNNQSVLEYAPDCTGNDRNKRWQFENTAQIIDRCAVPENPAYGEVEYEQDTQNVCYADVVTDTVAGPAQVPVDSGTDLVTYINTNIDDILASTDPLWAPIQAILGGAYPGDCTPTFGDNCDTPSLVEEIVLALSTDTETVTQDLLPVSEYEEVPEPSICNMYEVGNPLDSTFMSTYMRDWEIVYKRNPFPNTYCSTQTTAGVVQFIPPTVIDNPTYLVYQGSLGSIAPLQTSVTASQVSLPDGYTDKIHTNARWYFVEFNGLSELIVQLSVITNETTDDICLNTKRVSVFDSCSAPSDLAAYSRIISDMTLSSDPDKLIYLDANDFPSGIAYIAIDSPIKTDVEFEIELEIQEAVEITLTGTSGDAIITVDGTNYPFSFTAPDLTTTADQFVTDNAATILSAHNIVVTANLGVLTFTGDSPIVSITIANSSGDLDGVVTPIPPTGGTLDIEIDGNIYTATFNTDTTTTATDFVNDNTVLTTLNGNDYDILIGSNNIEVIASGNILTFRTTEDEYNSLSVTTTSGTLTGFVTETERYNTLRPTCGCANIVFRTALTRSVIEFTNLTFIKKQTWEATCSFSIPTLGNCDPIPYQYGLFSYWESTETYTCNKDLFDSSDICIEDDQLSFLSPEEKQEFIDYYVQQTVPGIPDLVTDPQHPCFGKYAWKEDASNTPLVNFRDRPIRHYKFPCSTKVPFMSYNDSTQSVFQEPGPFKDSLIYPIGFSITNEVINTFLDIAVTNELITLEERLKIKKYEIHTGDRSVDKSIIAKGMLFDMYEYKDNCPSDELGPNCDTAYYPNYPLNSLGTDFLNGNVPHRFNSASNNLFTFHSPDIHFYKPFLPNEMKIEGYLFGYSNTIFDEVKDHPKWTILGAGAHNLARFLAIAEVALEILANGTPVSVNALTGTFGAVAAGIIAGLFFIGYALLSLWKIGQLTYQWIEIFENFGNLHQFAYFGSTLGHYNFFKPNILPNNNLRGLPTIKYLSPGRIQIPDETAGSQSVFRVNNLDRSDSVFLNLGQYNLTYPSDYVTWDNFNTNPSTTSRFPRAYGKGQFSPIPDGKAASPYVSLKQYLPAQYGSIYSIDWVETGFCGDLSESYECKPIFGGDVYISRFAVKRKFPFFTSNAHQLADRTPFEYSAFFNVNPFVDSNRTFVDYKITDEDDQSAFFQFLWPSYKYPYQLTADNILLFNQQIPLFYIKPPNKFFLFSYGFPYFLVESTINCNYRYAKRQEFQDFYPNNQDISEMTQESNVSIRERNKYYYNFVYSSLQSQYPSRLLPSTYEKELYEKINDQDNTVIYSRQDGSETDLNDNWLLYKGLDTYTFPKTFGQLVDMDSIESEVILARFENGFTLFGAIDQIRDRVTPETGNIGQGGIFAGRSVNFNKTDLGYAGTQHVAKVSCNFGHFWPDMKRGQVFQLQPSGKGLKEITTGLSKWFKENLPFKILSGVSGLTQRDLDNNFKGLGVTMGWDARSSRVFLTKLDYKVKVDNIEYIDNNFYITQGEELVQISLKDEEYFEDCSFTIAYSPLTEMWISYYSFKPNYYIAYDNYFQTGVNYSVDSSEEGLWSHLPFLSSYQVFYGKLYPFIIESSLPSKASDSILESVDYWLDVRKYYNKYDYTDVYGQGFNKAFIYNNYQNSGQLNLVHQNNNDLSQAINYPKHNLDSIEILQSETNGRWSFNYFYNLIKSERAGLPIWKNDCNQIDKTLDNRLLDYANRFKDRLRGDYFLVRLQQDEESRFKMIYRFQTDIRDFYE